MILKRGTPKPLLTRLRDAIAPSMGWKRTTQYLKLRILRLQGSSKKIAAGLAVGVAVSFSPLIGTHILQAILFAYIFRFNIIAAVIGTLAGNPWTFPFMWWIAIWFGTHIFTAIGLPADVILPENINLTALWDLAMNEPMRIFLPWLVGGYWIAILSAPLFYIIFYCMTKTARKAHRKSRVKRHNQLKRKTKT